MSRWLVLVCSRCSKLVARQIHIDMFCACASTSRSWQYTPKHESLDFNHKLQHHLKPLIARFASGAACRSATAQSKGSAQDWGWAQPRFSSESEPVGPLHVFAHPLQPMFHVLHGFLQLLPLGMPLLLELRLCSKGFLQLGLPLQLLPLELLHT